MAATANQSVRHLLTKQGFTLTGRLSVRVVVFTGESLFLAPRAAHRPLQEQLGVQDALQANRARLTRLAGRVKRPHGKRSGR